MKAPLSLLVLALAFLLGSCASGLHTDYRGDDAGAIALSLQPGSTPIWEFSLILTAGPIPHPEDPKASVDWPQRELLGLGSTKPDFYDFNGGDGNVYLLHLRAGNYTVYEFYLDRRTSLYKGSIYLHPKFPLPIRVRPGRVVYIGSYTARLLYPADNCIITCARFEVVLSDQSKRDIKFLKRRYPQEPWSNILVELPYADAANQPAVVAPDWAKEWDYYHFKDY